MRHTSYRTQLLFSSCFIFLICFTSCKSSKHSSTSGKKSTTVFSKENEDKAEKVVKAARSYCGTCYKYGGCSKKGIDCSGLTMTAYQAVDIDIPRSSKDQSNFGKRIYIGELHKGDLVFFANSPGSKKITHVGVISSVSEESIKFIHASTKRGVTESELLSNWYRPRYVKAMRILN